MENNSGISIKLPQFPDFTNIEEFNTDAFLDSTQIEDLNKSLIEIVLKLREVSKKLNSYSRKKVEKETIYKHKFRNALLSVEAKTETQRKLLAELECEQEEIEIIYLDEVIKELTRYSFSLKNELETLKILGNNIRLEMKLWE